MTTRLAIERGLGSAQQDRRDAGEWPTWSRDAGVSHIDAWAMYYSTIIVVKLVKGVPTLLTQALRSRFGSVFKAVQMFRLAVGFPRIRRIHS